MHFLTKFLAIMAAIFAFVLSALTVSYASSADEIVRQFRDEQTRRATAEAELRAEGETANIRVTELEDQLQQLRNDLNERENEVARLQTQNVELRLASRDAEASRASLESNIVQLSVSNDKFADIIDNYRTQNGELWDNELRYRREKLELEDQIADLLSQNAVLDQRFRAVREQLIAVQSGGTAAETADLTQGIAYSGPPVSGSVSEVLDDVNGRPLVRVDLGSSDNIRENMKLMVSRGNQFIANLVVLETDLNTSVASVTLSNGGSIRRGDRVSTSTN